MKILFFFVFVPIFIFAQNVKNSEREYILEKFSEVRNKIYNLEYNVERIDTFSDGDISTLKGYALITRDEEDSEFGYHFFGECFDHPDQQNLYDGINSFDIDKEGKTYKITKSVKGYLGEQMIMRIAGMIFTPDNSYSNVVILFNDTSYIIEYQFKDEPPYTNFRKTVVLNKHTFLPAEFTVSGQYLSDRYSHKFILSDVKINEDVSTSIEEIKLKLTSYSMLAVEDKEVVKNLLNSAAPKYLLAKLSEPDSLVEIIKGKITLIDFWEVFCGYCIKSMPNVESIFNKFSNQIDVIGIVTRDSANAKKLVDKLGVTFISLIGNKSVLEAYGVDSFPRYFLIDKDGIVKKEYFSFSPQIEKDIIQLLKE